MASPVSHIIYAKKYLEKHPLHNSDEEMFFLGCVFPDIRRVADGLKRKDTHWKFDPIDLDFQGLSPFESGWKFHTYCDMKREEILNKYNFYSLAETTAFGHEPGKLLEDELIYSSYNNWEKIINYFNNPATVEIDLDVPCETFDLWYAMLAKYFKEKPSNTSMSALMSKQGSLANEAKDIIKSLDRLRKNKKAVEILLKVKEEII
jgi:hypothetical protein